MGLKYLKNYETFINEAYNMIKESATGTDRTNTFNPKLDKAADLIAAIVNRKTGKNYKKFPFVDVRKINGINTYGVIFHSDKTDDAFRVVGASGGTGAIVGSLEYYEDFGVSVASAIVSSSVFPITKLVGEFVQIMTNPAYIKSLMEADEFEYLYEAKRELSASEIKQVETMLDSGLSVREISKELGVPRKLIYELKQDVPTTEVKSEIEKKNEMTLEDKVKFLEETMEDIYDICRTIAAGAPNMYSLFITGRAGTGKSFWVEKAMKDEGLVQDVDFFTIKSGVSAIETYKKLFQFNDKILIFDDADGIFEDPEGRNLLKGALDTRPARRISWLKKNPELFDPVSWPDEEDQQQFIESGKLPNTFMYTGRIIFISNLSKKKADPDGAIRSRSILVDVNPDDATLMERLRILLPKLDPTDMPMEDKLEVFEFMKKANDISMRTFVKAAGLKMSGLANWQRKAERYL